MAAAVAAFENPVIGMIEPPPENFPSLSYIPKPVNTAAIPISVTATKALMPWEL